MKILIIEDEKPIAKLIEMNLGAANYETQIYYDGAEAAEALQQNHSYDLALLDVMLPGMDGFELLEIMKDYEIPVIFLTGRSDPDVVRTLLSLKPAGYLLKYLKPAEIKQKIDNFFEKGKI